MSRRELNAVPAEGIPTGPVLEFQGVGMRYGRAPEVLRDVSFELPRGSFHFLTGPSGAGKSSLLKLIYLAHRPSRGLITLFGVTGEGRWAALAGSLLAGQRFAGEPSLAYAGGTDDHHAGVIANFVQRMVNNRELILASGQRSAADHGHLITSATAIWP